MYTHGEDVFYYVTRLQRELRAAAEARGTSTRGSSRASTGSRRRPRSRTPRARVRLVGSGSILPQVLAAQDLLAEQFGIAAEVYSATSFQQLRHDALQVERWNRLHPDAEPRVPYVAQVLGPGRRTGDRRDRLDQDPARPGRAAGRPSRTSRSAPTGSAGATRARRCGPTSRSTRRTSPPPRSRASSRCGSIEAEGGRGRDPRARARPRGAGRPDRVAVRPPRQADSASSSARATGSRTTNRAPPPSRGSASIAPPIARSSERAAARPRPAPGPERLGGLRAVERLEQAIRLVRGERRARGPAPRARSCCRRRAAARRPRPACRRPRSAPRSASRLRTTWASAPSSATHRRQVGRDRGPDAEPRLGLDLGVDARRRASAGAGAGRPGSGLAPPSWRATASRSSTSRYRRSASSSTAATTSFRTGAGMSPWPAASTFVPRWIVVIGERSSCDRISTIRVGVRGDRRATALPRDDEPPMDAGSRPSRLGRATAPVRRCGGARPSRPRLPAAGHAPPSGTAQDRLRGRDECRVPIRRGSCSAAAAASTRGAGRAPIAASTPTCHGSRIVAPEHDVLDQARCRS